MADVFISYHAKSAGKLVEQIVDALESAGISCWYAKRDIPAGGDFARYIPPQIDACRLFLLILNEEVYQSKHIENEVGLAFSRLNKGEDIAILPIETEGFERKSWIRYYLIHTQSVKMPTLNPERIHDLAQQAANLLNREIPSTPTQDMEPLKPVTPPKILKSGTCGLDAYTLDENGVLTISGNAPMWNYRRLQGAVNTPWWSERKNILHVEIQSGVTKIGWSAFVSCANLKSVTIPSTVTEIGSTAFANCVALTNITIPDSVMNIGEYAFFGCEGLTNLTVSGAVKIEADAFYGCVKLTSVTIRDGSKKITGDFRWFTRLESVTIPDSVTEIAWGAFSECARLKSVKIPESVIEIGSYAFKKCVGLTSVTIPDSVTKIGSGAFEGCVGLISVKIPDSVTKIEWSAFEGCKKLTSVTIPDSVIEIGHCAFKDCTKLTNVTIPDSVTRIQSNAFEGCTNLTSVSVPRCATVEKDAFPRSVYAYHR